MVHDDEPVGLDGLRAEFNDERAVSDAGVMLVATLVKRLGIEMLAGRLVRLRRDRPGAANAGRKVMALLFAMVLGAEGIDDCEVLRAGRTRRLLGGWMPAPSTLGTFLRAFTFGHVRQLDALLGEALVRAWRAGAGPGEGRLVIDVDSFVGEVCGRLKQGAAYGYTKLLGYHPILATRADTREVLHIRLRKGSANTQKGMLRFTDELIARVARAGASGLKLLRADSGFWNVKVFKRLEQAGWQYSIGVRMIKTVRAAVEAIDESAWQPIENYPQEGEAQFAETTYGGVGDQEAGVLGVRAQLIPQARVRIERRNGARVKRNLTRAAVLAVADREPTHRQLDLAAIERDYLADPHPGHSQQPDQRLIRRGLQRRADLASCSHRRLDVRLGIQVGRGAAELRRQQVSGRHLGARIDRLQVQSEAADDRQTLMPPHDAGVLRLGRELERQAGGDHRRVPCLEEATNCASTRPWIVSL